MPNERAQVLAINKRAITVTTQRELQQHPLARSVGQVDSERRSLNQGIAQIPDPKT